jgi:hypothetical protein
MGQRAIEASESPLAAGKAIESAVAKKQSHRSGSSQFGRLFQGKSLFGTFSRLLNGGHFSYLFEPTILQTSF